MVKHSPKDKNESPDDLRIHLRAHIESVTMNQAKFYALLSDSKFNEELEGAVNKTAAYVADYFRKDVIVADIHTKRGSIEVFAVLYVKNFFTVAVTLDSALHMPETLERIGQTFRSMLYRWVTKIEAPLIEAQASIPQPFPKQSPPPVDLPDYRWATLAVLVLVTLGYTIWETSQQPAPLSPSGAPLDKTTDGMPGKQAPDRRPSGRGDRLPSEPPCYVYDSIILRDGTEILIPVECGR